MERERARGTAEAQARIWGQRARDWANLLEGTMRPVYESVLDGFAVSRGTRLLDVGCGAGGFLRLASERGALVSGLDATPELLEIARERVLLGDIRQGEIEELPFADEAFDLVTGFNAFQFAAQPARALAEAKRVIHVGGAVVMAVWGRLEQCEAAEVLGAIGALMPPPAAEGPGPFALSPPGVLEELAGSAGLTVVRAVEVGCPFEFPDRQTAMRGFASPGPAAAAREHSGEEALTAALADVLARFEQPGGSVRLENVFRYVIATP
jgi:SAM-dependent methyltransferase